jgi:peptidoglycan/LPS O-acetylase OafA/YrhL
MVDRPANGGQMSLVVDDLEIVAAAPARPVERRFRPDVQGLRAIAVLLVVLYHAHVPGVTGGFVGVDVFFVISGFLITGQLDRELQRRGRISFLGFYGRRARRLLPPAAFVVVVTVLAARLWEPASQVRSLIRDVFFTAVYGVNVHFAGQGVLYSHASETPSALQHFWSLAVEEQFYLGWPLLLVVFGLLARRRRRVFTVGVLAAIVLASLAASVLVTRSNPAMAYFSLQTRAWELGLGALVALASTRLLALPTRTAAVLSWLGLIGIIASGLWYDDSTPYPGSAAALPVVSTAVLIAAGCVGVPVGAERLLARRVPQLVGKHSYSWYLWHWPMLILLPMAADEVAFSWHLNLEVLALAFWAAVLTYFLENAAHRSTVHIGAWVPGGLALSALTVVVALALGATLLPSVGTGAAAAAPVLSRPDDAHIASVLQSSLATTHAPRNLTPRVDLATQDLPRSTKDGCHRDLLSTVASPCVYGSSAPGAPVAVLLGDSHAQQWLGALLPAVQAKGWKLLEWTKAACPISGLDLWNSDLKRTYPECTSWQAKVLPQITALHPDLVIASQSDAVPWTAITNDVWAAKTIQTLKATGAKNVVYLADTPQTAVNPVDCLERHLSDVATCSYPRAEAFQGFDGFGTRRGVLAHDLRAAGFTWVDTLPWFCAETRCPAVVGNLTVRRDQGHVTNTYARWLAPALTPLFES